MNLTELCHFVKFLYMRLEAIKVKKIMSYVLGFGLLFLLINSINSCCKKTGLIQPNKCKEMKYITIDNEEINGYPNNLKTKYNKFFYLDNERFVEVKEVFCTRFGYWDEN